MPSFFRRRDRHSEPNLLRSLLLGTLTGILAAAVLLTVCSLVLSRTGDPHRWLLPMALLAQTASAFSAGIAGGRTYRRAGTVAGLGCGVLYVLLLLILSFCVPGGETRPGWTALIIYPVCVLLAAAGGMLASRKSAKRRRPRRA